MSHLYACFWAKHLYTEKIPECGGSVRRPRKLEPCSACPSRARAVCPPTVCFTQGVMCSETRTALWRVLLSPCTVSQTHLMIGVTKDLCNNVGSSAQSIESESQEMWYQLAFSVSLDTKRTKTWVLFSWACLRESNELCTSPSSDFSLYNYSHRYTCKTN